MTRTVGQRLAPLRTGVHWLLGALALAALEPVSASRAAAAEPEERDPQQELILLASGSVGGHLEPCG